MSAPQTPVRSAVRERRALLATQLMHTTAQGLVNTAVPWLILAGGGAVWGAAASVALSAAPYLLLGLVAGAVGDRVGVRALLVAAQAPLVAVCALVALTGSSGSLPPLLATILVCGAARVFVEAALFRGVADQAPGPEQLAAQGALTAALNVGTFAGPVLAGVLLTLAGGTVTLASAAAAYALALCLSAASATSRQRASRGGARTSPVDALTAGLRLLWRDRLLRRMTAVGVAWNVLGGAHIGLLLPLLRRELGYSGAVATGVLAAGALAPLLAPSLLRRLATLQLSGPLILVRGLALYPLPLLGLALVTHPVPVGALYAALAIGATVCGSALAATRVLRAPLELRALVSTTGRTLMTTGWAGGALAAGWVAELLGVQPSYALLGGAGVVLAVAAAAVLRHDLAQATASSPLATVRLPTR